MAKAKAITTHADAMEFDDRDYFTYAAIFNLLAESVRKHDPALFNRCAAAIDTAPISTLRGLAYLSQLLTNDRDCSDMQRRLANGAIAEITGLMPVILEMQNSLESYKQIERFKNATEEGANHG